VTTTDSSIHAGYVAGRIFVERRRRIGQRANTTHTAQPTWRLGIAAKGFVDPSHAGAADSFFVATTPASGVWSGLRLWLVSVRCVGPGTRRGGLTGRSQKASSASPSRARNALRATR